MLSFANFCAKRRTMTPAQAADHFGLYVADFGDAARVHVYADSFWVAELPGLKFWSIVGVDEFLSSDLEAVARFGFLNHYRHEHPPEDEGDWHEVARVFMDFHRFTPHRETGQLMHCKPASLDEWLYEYGDRLPVSVNREGAAILRAFEPA